MSSKDIDPSNPRGRNEVKSGFGGKEQMQQKHRDRGIELGKKRRDEAVRKAKQELDSVTMDLFGHRLLLPKDLGNDIDSSQCQCLTWM